MSEWVNVTLSVWWTCVFIVVLHQWAWPTAYPLDLTHEEEGNERTADPGDRSGD